MADVALHGPDADERTSWTMLPPAPLHGLYLVRVQIGNATSVAFNQLNGLERGSRPLDRRRENRVHRRGTAGARTHEGIDSIMGAEGIHLALEHEERAALPGDRPLRIPVERRELGRL